MKERSVDHPADFDISLNDNPAALHFDVSAALVECDPNMSTLNPDSFIMRTPSRECSSRNWLMRFDIT